MFMSDHLFQKENTDTPTTALSTFNVHFITSILFIWLNYTKGNSKHIQKFKKNDQFGLYTLTPCYAVC